MTRRPALHEVGLVRLPEPEKPQWIRVGPRVNSWSDDDGRITARTTVVSGVGALSLHGRLSPAVLPTCWSALSAALRVRTPIIVLDLSEAIVDHTSIPVLRLMDRAATRHGAALWMVGLKLSEYSIGPADQAWLRSDHRDFATLSVALETALTPNRPGRPTD